MPCVGLGTLQSLPGEVEAAVAHALDAGVRMLDCAYIYQNEDQIGKVVKEYIDSGGSKFVTVLSRLTSSRNLLQCPGHNDCPFKERLQGTVSWLTVL